MNSIIIILRIIHIFSGVFWVGIFSRMQGIGQEIQAQGAPPTPQQTAEMQALGARLAKVGQIGVVFMIVALLGMSVAQYITF